MLVLALSAKVCRSQYLESKYVGVGIQCQRVLVFGDKVCWCWYSMLNYAGVGDW